MSVVINGTTGVTVPPGASGARVPQAQEVYQSLRAKNKVLNGKMEIGQEGTNWVAAANFTYVLDQWRYSKSGSMVSTVGQVEDSSSGEFRVSLRNTVTTADTSIAATDYSILEHLIEGYDVRDLVGRSFTLSFWVRSSKTGTHCVALRNSGLDRAYVAEYEVESANSWEKKSITFLDGLITAGTWNWTNGAGLRLAFTMSAGANYQTTAGTWQTGSFIATANQVNCEDTVGNIFAITGVQLEVGIVATDFEHLPYGEMLARCQRYFWRGWPSSDLNSNAFNTTAIVSWPVNFPVPMRATPTLTSDFTGLNLFGLSSPSWTGPTLTGGRLLFNAAGPNSNVYYIYGPPAYLQANARLI